MATYIQYMPPTPLRDPLPEFVRKEYNPITVRDSLNNLIGRFCTQAGGRDDFAWSLYDTLGIPDGCLVENGSMIQLMNTLGARFGMNMACLNTRVVAQGTEYLFLQNASARKVAGRHYELHVEDDGTMVPMVDQYKLHVCVKHRYVMYTVMKLCQLNNEPTDRRPFHMKFSLNSRLFEISAENTMALDMAINGGSLPPIVVYVGPHPENLQWLFRRMNALFSAEDRAEMGLMTGEPTRIPPMNVRLNEMFAYALGDRVEKLEAYAANAAAGRDPCRLPAWLLAHIGRCGEPAVAAQLQDWFSEPVCDRVVDGRLPLRDRLCYLSLSARDMLAPSQVGGKTRSTKKRKTRRIKRKQHTK